MLELLYFMDSQYYPNLLFYLILFLKDMENAMLNDMLICFTPSTYFGTIFSRKINYIKA